MLWLWWITTFTSLVVTEHLQLPNDGVLVCAMSLGYADVSRIENTLSSERAPLETFVTFHD
jgi:hypothetical protein